MKQRVIVTLLSALWCVIGLGGSACSTPATIESPASSSLSSGQDDSMVVRKASPINRELPEPQPDSFLKVNFGIAVSRADTGSAESPLVVSPMDRIRRPDPEPFDLDLLVRIEGGPGTWINGLDVNRYLCPLGVEEGTGTVIRAHVFDWSQAELEAGERTVSFGPTDGRIVEGDLYIEFSLADRGELADGSWFLLQRVRYRFRSDHKHWDVSNTRLIFSTSDGLEVGADLFLPDAE